MLKYEPIYEACIGDFKKGTLIPGKIRIYDSIFLIEAINKLA